MPDIKNPLHFHQVTMEGYAVKPTKIGQFITVKLTMPYRPDTLAGLIQLQDRMLGWIVECYPELMGKMMDPETGAIVYDPGDIDGAGLQLSLMQQLGDAVEAAEQGAEQAEGEPV